MNKESPPTSHTPAAEMTRLINGTRVSLLGWGRAILLQLAHPLVAAGVRDHSRFEHGTFTPLRRLHGTVNAMLAMSFGSDAECAQAAAGINAIHDRVHGTLRQAVGRYPAGTPYSAHDPELLRWVFLTLLDSMPMAYSRFVSPLDDEQVGRYCRESTRGAVLLGLAPDMLPDSISDLRRRVDEVLSSDVLAVGDDARALAGRLLNPPLARVAAPFLGLHRLATVGWLPDPIREAYGFTWTARDALRLERWEARLRTMSRLAPPVLTRWPAARREFAGHAEELA